jgi:hypothetical protein
MGISPSRSGRTVAAPRRSRLSAGCTFRNRCRDHCRLPSRFHLAISYYITPATGGGPTVLNYFSLYTNQTLSWELAAALGLVLLAVTLILYGVYTKLAGPSGKLALTCSCHVSSRSSKPPLRVLRFCALVFVFWYADCGCSSVVVNSGTFLTYPLEGVLPSLVRRFLYFPTLAWRASIVVGIATTAIATPLGTLAALGPRARRVQAQADRYRAAHLAADRTGHHPAIGIYFVYAPLGLTSSRGLVLAHSVLALRSSSCRPCHAARFDPALWRAALSLGAACRRVP